MKREKTGRRPKVTVAVRRQTPEERRRFDAALELLLTEMVRQEIARRRGHDDEGESTTR